MIAFSVLCGTGECAHFMFSSIKVVTARLPKHSHKIGHNSQKFQGFSVEDLHLSYPEPFISRVHLPEIGRNCLIWNSAMRCTATKFTEALGIPKRVMVSLSSDPATSDIIYISGSMFFDAIKSVPAQ